MGLFSRGDKNKSPAQAEKRSLFGGKKFQNQQIEDYSQYSERRLFAQFKSENWNAKTDADKIAVLQEVENREAATHNRPAAKVTQAYGSSYGGYSNGAHRIEIRLTDNQFEDLDTLFHESEHANQEKASMDSVSFSENDKKLMQLESMTSSDGISSHYNKYGSSLYKVMTSELDANNVAIEKVSSLKDEYVTEEKYQRYLFDRQEYYDGLSDAIDLKYTEKKAALLNTVECAYIRSELSEREYSELKELITNTENYDSCEKRAIEFNEILSQVDMQDEFSIVNFSLDKEYVSNDGQAADLIEGKDSISRYQVVDAAQIQNINNVSDNFWNHHGNTKEDYMELASKLPEIQKEFENGKTYTEISANSELHDTLVAYYSDDKMIQVVQDQNGNYQYQDDGRHRVMAAQEMGCHIPVNVINSEEPVIANYYENQQSVSDAMAVDTDKEIDSMDQDSFERLSAYMREHNYGRADFEEYSQDPVWRELHTAAYPDYELPPLNDSKEDNISAEKREILKDEENEVNEEDETEIEEKEETEDEEVKEEDEIEPEEETEEEEVEEEDEIEAEEETELEEDSVMITEVDNTELDYEDSSYEEDSLMIEDLDDVQGNSEIENDSEMIDALGENDSMDNSTSESCDDSVSNDGGMDLE